MARRLHIGQAVETTLELAITCNDETAAYSFTEFPVRIGRDPSCELPLAHPFVSRKHARIERDATEGFVLVDEGGRHGLSVNGVKVEREQCVALDDGAEIRIETLVAKVRVRVPDDNATALCAGQAIVPTFLARVGKAMEEYREARAAALATVSNALAAVPASQRADFARRLATAHDELASDPTFGVMPELPEAERTAPMPSPAEAALRGLQQLAATHAPDSPPPGATLEVDAFLCAIDRTLSVFLQCKGWLDAVYRSDEGAAEVAEERARRTGAELLDWRGDTSAAAAARTSREFAELAAHDLGLVAEIDAGVQGILHALSPAAIAAVAKGSRWSWTLWREHARQHAAVAATLHERLGARYCRALATLRTPRMAATVPQGASEDSDQPRRTLRLLDVPKRVQSRAAWMAEQ